MYQTKPYRERTWAGKFRDAFRGVKEGVRGQSSFFVHFFTAAVVILAGFMLGMDSTQWCLLVVCITTVFCAEMFNSSLESLARAITDESDPHVGSALNIGSAAVLVAAIGAVVVGAIVFLDHLAEWW